MFSLLSDFLRHSLIASSASADLRTFTFLLPLRPRLKIKYHTFHFSRAHTVLDARLRRVPSEAIRGRLNLPLCRVTHHL